MDTHELPEFGGLLRQHRAAAGLTQEALAELAGVSTRTIADLERGVIRAPQRNTFQMLASALKLPATERQSLENLRRQLSSRQPRTHGNERRGALLPQQPNRLIGREREVSALVNLLTQPTTRLVTITGPGGVGKTRIALAVGYELVDAFRDGLHFVELALIRDPDLLLPAIARQLGLGEGDTETIRERLTTYLARRDTMLILDNVEHLRTAPADLSDLLAHSQSLKILATSRSGLHISAEYEFPVSPLRLPDWDAQTDSAWLLNYPSIELFVQRGRQVRPDFTLTSSNGQAISSICSYLDGIPLAIELAAARVKVLTPEQMLPKLADRLGFLTSGLLDSPERHQTMRAAIAWSYDLLEPDQQHFFRQLSVFVGGWSLEAAEAVVPDGMSAIDGLARLANDNLIYQSTQPDGYYRFNMLETIRAFASDQLTGLDETDQAHEAHADYFLSLAEKVEAGLSSPEQGYWLDVLTAEIENFRLALDWFNRADPESGMRVTAAIYLGLSHVVPVEVESEIGLRLGRLHGRGASSGADTLAGSGWFLPEVIENSRDLKVKQGVLAAAGIYGFACGPWDIESYELLEQSLEIATELEDKPAIAWTLHLLGRRTELNSDQTLAAGYFRRSIAIAEEINDLWIEAWGHHRFGFFYYVVLGDRERAEHHYQRSLALREQIGYQEGVSVIWSLLGVIRFEDDEVELALDLFQRSLSKLRDLRALWLVVIVIANCAAIAARLGDHVRAARLGSFCTTTMQWLGRDALPLSTERFRRGLEVARENLDRQEFEDAWRQGERLSMEDAIEEALSIR